MDATTWARAKADFDRDGFVLLPGFYDVAGQIEPIHEEIRRVIEVVATKHGLEAPVDTPELAMADGMATIAAANRSWAGTVYDAVKQIPAFLRLVSAPRNAALFEALRPGALPGIAAGGFGIRIDHPGEDRFRAAWHQEFPAQLRSLDGLVFWTPLAPVSPALGPVQIATGSHAAGPAPVYEDTGGIERPGAYRLRLLDESERLAPYEIVQPCPMPGDLLVMDFLTLHRSGFNTSDRARWSIQFRYFNFLDPVGQRIDWSGAFAEGVDFSLLFPELKR